MRECPYFDECEMHSLQVPDEFVGHLVLEHGYSREEAISELEDSSQKGGME